MNIYEAVGIFWIILTCCFAHVVLGILLYRGFMSLANRAEIGKMAEDTWTREYLRPVIETFRTGK